jgi:uncharacterized protein YjbJ (UPF0337 family)
MEGKLDQAKGRVKQAAGDLTGNSRLKTEGKVDHARGTVKEKVDQASRAIKKRV